MEDWLKKWYKKGFSEMKTQPSNNIWKRIAGIMEDWPGMWYQKNHHDISIQPKYNLWNEIEANLTTTQPQSIFSGRFVILSLFFIGLPFIILTPDLLRESHDINGIQYSITDTSLHATPKEQIIHAREEFSNNNKTVAKKQLPKNSNRKNERGSYSIVENQMTETQDSDLIGKMVENLDAYDSPLPSTVELPIHAKYFLAHSQKPNLRLTEILPQNNNNERWAIGAIGLIQRGSIINPMASYANSMNSGLNLTNRVNAAVSIGLVYKKNTHNRFSADIVLNNTNTLEYKKVNSYQDDYFFSMKTLQFNVSHQRLLASFHQKKFELHSSQGILIGTPYQITETENNIYRPILIDGIRSVNLGLIVGCELNYKLSHTYSAFSRVSYSLGLTNLFGGTVEIPAKLLPTRTSTLDFGIGIRRTIF
jgi:hypothetical protein